MLHMQNIRTVNWYNDTQVAFLDPPAHRASFIYALPARPLNLPAMGSRAAVNVEPWKDKHFWQ